MSLLPPDPCEAYSVIFANAHRGVSFKVDSYTSYSS